MNVYNVLKRLIIIFHSFFSHFYSSIIRWLAPLLYGYHTHTHRSRRRTGQRGFLLQYSPGVIFSLSIISIIMLWEGRKRGSVALTFGNVFTDDDSKGDRVIRNHCVANVSCAFANIKTNVSNFPKMPALSVVLVVGIPSSLSFLVMIDQKISLLLVL